MALDIKWNHLTETLNRFADFFIQEARNNLQENGSNASYNLFNSFEKYIEIGEDYFSVKVSMEDYWPYVEKGRGAGRFPPVDKIREWIQVKPIQAIPDVNGRIPSVEQLTFLIGRKIAEEGTEAKPFFEPAKQEAIKKFELEIELAIDEDIDTYVIEQVDEFMKRYDI